jgi:hypothetical protein
MDAALDREPVSRRELRNMTSRGGAGGCAESGCAGRTMGGKPYCIAHLHRRPYIAAILAREAARAAEIAGRTFEPGGVVAEELRGQLRVCPMTVAAISRILGLPYKVAGALVRQLRLRGVVRIDRHERNVFIVLR